MYISLKQSTYLSFTILGLLTLKTGIVSAMPPATTNGENSVYSWEDEAIQANTSFYVLLPENLRYYLNIKKTSYDDGSKICPISYTYEDGAFLIDRHGGNSTKPIPTGSGDEEDPYVYDGDFVANYASGSSSASGGAIYNDYGSTIKTLTGDFIGNYASGNNYAYGGAIYNDYGSTIKTLTGDFIGNYASGNNSARGGAIYNDYGTITTLTGDFIGNYASSENGEAEGGGIYNYGGTISNLRGDFISNKAWGFEYAEGGAIYNRKGTISALTGDFIDNHVSGDGESSGGAIYNDYGSTIKTLTGDFIGNYATGSMSSGGAIYNDGTISTLTGDFIGNFNSENYYAKGGAIYNRNGTISALTGDFIDNHVSGTYADGGAIYNEYGTINLVDSSFIGNKAKEGAAIYNYDGTITITAKNKDILFSNNNQTGEEGGAGTGIYGGKDSTISLNAASDRTITINDEVYSKNKFNINTDATYHGGTVYFNAPFSGYGALDINDGTVILGNSSPLSAYSVIVGSNATFDIGTSSVTSDYATINGLLKMSITNLSAGSEVYEGGKMNVESLTLGDESKLYVTVAPGLLKYQQSSGVLTLIEADEIEGSFNKVLSNERYDIQEVETGKVMITSVYSAEEVVKEAGGSDNNAHSATAWDEAEALSGKAEAVQEVLNELSQHNPKEYVEALTNLAPTDSMIHVGVTQDVNSLIADQVTLRLEGLGVNSGDVFNGGGAWVQTLYNQTKQDQTIKSTGFKGKTAGVAFGLDGKIDEDTTIGLGYAYAKTKVDSAQRRTDVKTHSIYAYGQYQPSKWYVGGMVNYGFAKYDERANVSTILNEANYDVRNYGVRANIGYNFENGLTPEASLRYTYITREDYKDEVGQEVKTNDIDILTAKVGVKYGQTLQAKNVTFKPTAHIGVTYDLLSSNTTANVQIANSSYTIRAQKLNRFGLEGGVGLQMSVNDWDFFAEYAISKREHYQSHTGLLKARYNF